MKYVKDKKFRLRASVALVYNNGILHLFRTNVRENIFLEINFEHIVDVLLQFDGLHTIEEIAYKNNIDINILSQLVTYLNTKFVLIEEDELYPENLIKNKYRIINFLEDFCFKTSDVIQKIENLKQKQVLIVGLGAVGTWIADILARNGVENFILMDNDIVDISNLHRQHMYFEEDIGKFKVDCVETQLKNLNDKINIIKIKKKLEKDSFDKFNYHCDFVINCADYPSVDYTTNIIGEFCMKKNIPHIVGGGYNLHLTLIGQTVLPYKTACYECFNTKLQEINNFVTKGLKKLNRKNRKIGSFAPLSTISASLSTLDIFKILCDIDNFVVNDSKRIEFNIKSMDFNIMQIDKNPNCQICSEKKKNVD